MDRTELSSDGFPPSYPDDFEPVPTPSPSSPAAAAAVPVPMPSPAVHPVMQTQQVTVRYHDGDRMEEVPLVQSFVSHMLLACFTFWCCGGICGLIAFILAGRRITLL